MKPLTKKELAAFSKFIAGLSPKGVDAVEQILINSAKKVSPELYKKMLRRQKRFLRKRKL